MAKFSIILFLLTTATLRSQTFSAEEQFTLDSLYSVIDNTSTHDTTKAMTYMHIATYYYTTNLDTTEKLCLEACKLSENHNFADGMAESYGWLGYIAQNYGNNELGLEYQIKSLNLQLEVGKKHEIALAHNNLGGTYEGINNTELALEQYSVALKLYSELNDLVGISLLLNNIAGIYTNQGKFLKALNCLDVSLKIREKIDDKEGIAYCLNNIGYLYDTQNDNDNALLHYRKSLTIREQIGDDYGIAMSLNNIGYLYINLNLNDSALFYITKSLKIQEDLGDKYGTAYSLNNIASIYRNKDSIGSAITYYNKSLQIFEEIQDQEGISMVLNNLGNIQFNGNQINTAETTAKRSYEIATIIGYPDDIMSSSELLSKVYEKQQKWKDALMTYKVHVEMKDSLSNNETQKAAIKQQTKYEYDKQKLIDDLENSKRVAIEKEGKDKQRTITIAVVLVLVLVVLFLIFIFNRLQLTKKQNLVIEKQKSEAEEQKEIIEETHREITDSIRYAKRLQDAILPSHEGLTTEIPQSFVLFKPKDVVSGDFYWLEKNNDTVYLAVGDCTGHGVPGALVSVVCSNALNRTLKEFNITAPNKILDKTRELVIETFAKSGENIQDGMDISLCAFSENKILFSGANNPIWIVKPSINLTDEQRNNPNTISEGDNSIVEYKGDKQPVGLYHEMKDFTQIEIPYQTGDSIYLFTDGYADQFGGEKGKKLKYKPFKKFLLNQFNIPMHEQKEKLNSHIENWRGELEQIDDICVIGIKIS